MCLLVVDFLRQQFTLEEFYTDINDFSSVFKSGSLGKSFARTFSI